MKAMLLAAGLGTRLKPFTDHHPKALVPVNGKPVMQRNIEFLQQYGITDIIVNVHHFSNQIIEALRLNNAWGSNYIISDESDEVLETGGGLLKAKSLLCDEEDFVLMNADMLTDLNIASMINLHEQQQNMATLAVTARTSSRSFLFDDSMNLQGWQDTKNNNIRLNVNVDRNTLTPYAFSGVHVINASLFNHINFTGKFSIVDVYLDICGVQKIMGYNHSGGLLFDVGTLEKVAIAEKFIF
jgi:N-acetyl-alpha-D-muramate 1-phosphate uridylyltransferase